MGDVGAIHPAQRVQETHLSMDAPFEPTKPVIPRMIHLHSSLGKTGDLAAHAILDRLEQEHVQLQVWTKHQLDHLQTVANRTWLEHGWSVLKTVADCVISVVSFAMGGYLLASGHTTEGNALIAAGVFNILQAVFTRQGMWDWISETLAEKNEAHRDRLKKIFPIVVTLLSIAFSIAGSKYASNLQPRGLVQHLESAKNVIDMGNQGLSSIFSLKKGYDDAKLPEIQGALKKHEQTADMLSRLVEFSIQESRRIKSTIKKPINALMQATTLAAQKV